MDVSALKESAQLYVAARGLSTTLSRLGEGTDGAVWLSSALTAIKVFPRMAAFETELECYLRLSAAEVSEINGFSVPRLLGRDRMRQIIEMTTVSPPYLIDFGKAYLDSPPDFSPETLQYADGEIRELYEDHYGEVMKVVRALRRFGIFYHDVKPGNILPASWNPAV